MGAAARPFMFRAAICCIWAAAKAAMGFRYPPCATDAMIAACCCISWNKESRKKYHAVTGGAACGTGSRRAPGERVMHPEVLGCQHTTPVVPPPPQAWSFSSLQGLEAKGVFAAWGLYGPHPAMCSLAWRPPVTWTQPTGSLVLLLSERQRKVIIQTKHNIFEQSGFVAYIAYIKTLEVTDGRPVYVGKGDSFYKAEILTSSLEIT